MMKNKLKLDGKPGFLLLWVFGRQLWYGFIIHIAFTSFILKSYTKTLQSRFYCLWNKRPTTFCSNDVLNDKMSFGVESEDDIYYVGKWGVSLIFLGFPRMIGFKSMKGELRCREIQSLEYLVKKWKRNDFTYSNNVKDIKRKYVYFPYALPCIELSNLKSYH